MKYRLENRKGTVSYDYEFICDALVGMKFFHTLGVTMYLKREED